MGFLMFIVAFLLVPGLAFALFGGLGLLSLPLAVILAGNGLYSVFSASGHLARRWRRLRGKPEPPAYDPIEELRAQRRLIGGAGATRRTP